MMELRRCSRNWLSALPKRNPRVERIDRATAAAILGMEAATLGIRQLRHLLTAHTAMIRCAGSFKLLMSDKEIAPHIYDEARRRIDQIVAALERMMSSGGGDGAPGSATPEIEPAPINGLSEPVAALLQVLERADDDARRIAEVADGATPKPEPSSS